MTCSEALELARHFSLLASLGALLIGMFIGIVLRSPR